MAADLSRIVKAHLDGHRALLDAIDPLLPQLEAAARDMAGRLEGGGSVWLAGNGGSAADAQHVAAEMEGRLETERPARAVHTLGGNPSTLTAVANDYGFDRVFARQIEGFAREGDLLWLFSTSGKSANLVAAAAAARAKGVAVLGFLGKGGGPLAPLCDMAIVLPADDTQWIQEHHIIMGHLICKLVDTLMAE